MASYDANTTSVLMAAGYNDVSPGDSVARWHGDVDPLNAVGTLTPRYAPGVVYDLAITRMCCSAAATIPPFTATPSRGRQQRHVATDRAGHEPRWSRLLSAAWDQTVAGSPCSVAAGRQSTGDTGSANTWLSPTVVNPPSPRYGYSLVFDAQSNACMLFMATCRRACRPPYRRGLNGTVTCSRRSRARALLSRHRL